MQPIVRLVMRRRNPIVQQLLYLLGVEIAKEVPIGENLGLPHRGRGVIITRHAEIGRDVKIFPGVVIGRTDAADTEPEPSSQPAVIICDRAVLLPGAVIVGTPSAPTVVEEGTVIGPNSVLLESTGPNEVWGGIPARRLKETSPLS